MNNDNNEHGHIYGSFLFYFHRIERENKKRNDNSEIEHAMPRVNFEFVIHIHGAVWNITYKRINEHASRGCDKYIKLYIV